MRARHVLVIQSFAPIALPRCTVRGGDICIPYMSSTSFTPWLRDCFEIFSIMQGTCFCLRCALSKSHRPFHAALSLTGLRATRRHIGVLIVTRAPTLTFQQIDKAAFPWGQLPHGSAKRSFVIARRVVVLTGWVHRILRAQHSVVFPVLVLKLL